MLFAKNGRNVKKHSPAFSAAAAQGSGHVTEREVDEDQCDLGWGGFTKHHSPYGSNVHIFLVRPFEIILKSLVQIKLT